MDTVCGMYLHKCRNGKQEIGNMWSQHNFGKNRKNKRILFLNHFSSEGWSLLSYEACNNAKKLHKTVENSGFSQIIIGKGEPWRCLTLTCSKTYTCLNRNCSKTFLATSLSSSKYIILISASLSHDHHRSTGCLSEGCRLFEVYWVHGLLSSNLIFF